MATNRWLITIGMIILILMLVISAFSLGVYIGEHGWTRQGLQYQPGGQPIPPAGMPPQNPQPPVGDQIPGIGQPQVGNRLPPPGLPPGPPQITGRIRSISHTTIDLLTPNGLRQINIDGQTRFKNEQGIDIGREKFAVDDVVGVYGRVVQIDNGNQFVAELVFKLPPQLRNSP